MVLGKQICRESVINKKGGIKEAYLNIGQHVLSEGASYRIICMVYLLLLQNKNIRTIASGYLWLTVTSPFWLLSFNPSMQLQRKQPCCWDMCAPLIRMDSFKNLNLPRELWDCDQECSVSVWLLA